MAYRCGWTLADHTGDHTLGWIRCDLEIDHQGDHRTDGRRNFEPHISRQTAYASSTGGPDYFDVDTSWPRAETWPQVKVEPREPDIILTAAEARMLMSTMAKGTPQHRLLESRIRRAEAAARNVHNAFHPSL